MPEILTIGGKVKKRHHRRQLTNTSNMNDASFFIEDENLIPKDKEKMEDVIKTYIVKIFKGKDIKFLIDKNRKSEIIKMISTTNYGRHNLTSKNAN